MITKEELINKISLKERELLNLNSEYEDIIKEEKTQILNTKNKDNFTKSLYLLSFEFESSSIRTQQYLEFHKVFKSELKKVLKPYIKNIEISKPNHFDFSGFIKLNDDRIFYLSLSDLRYSKDNIIIRTAKDFKDYYGGSNNFIKLDKNFKENLLNYLRMV